MNAHHSLRMFLCAVLALLMVEGVARAQRGRSHVHPVPNVNWYYRTPYSYQFYSGNPYRYLYGYPTSYAYYRTPFGFDYRTYYGNPNSYLYGVPYSYAVTRSSLGSNYRYFVGNPNSVPASYAYYRTPNGYQYRAIYGNPNNYLYGIPYAYSISRTPWSSNYSYFIGNPNSYPISYVSYRTPYGYEYRAIFGSPGYVNPYIPWLPSAGAGPYAVGAPMPSAGSQSVPLPFNRDGADMGKLDWPIGLRILPGAAPLRERIDAAYQEAASQATAGSVPANLQELKRAVEQLQQHLARDRRERLSLSDTMYEHSEQFLRRLQELTQLFANPGLPPPGKN